MPGILYLIPSTLLYPAAETAHSENIAWVIPTEVQILTARLDYFIAENAKSTRAFLKQLGLHQALAKPLQQIQIAELNIQTPPAALPALLAPLLQGQDGGLISEAGVPAIADPGANLVRLAHQSQITVKPLVGPCSLLLALMASGLQGQRFAFNGYLPIEEKARRQRIQELEQRARREQQTQLFIETPYRNQALLEALLATCQTNTLLSIATDLTLAAESIHTHSILEWKKLFQDLPFKTHFNLHKKPSVFLLLGT